CLPRVTATSDRYRGPSANVAVARPMPWDSLMSTGCSQRRTQHDAERYFAGRHQLPQCDEQLARQRDNQCFTGGAAGFGGTGSVPLRQRAVLLEHQKAPSQLDHAAPHPGIACPGQSFLPPTRPALVRRAGQTAITRHRSAVTQAARERLVREHVCGLDAKTADLRQQSDHRMGAAIGLLFQPLQARGLDLPDLLGEQAQSCHLAPQLGQGVGRHRLSLRRAQLLEPLRGRAQGRLEAADAKARERALDPVADPRAVADEVLALTARPLGVLLYTARDRRHAAVFPLAAQPAEKSSLQQRRVEPIGLRPAMFARDGNAVRMDHIGFDAVRPHPTGQPETVAAGFEGDRYPFDGAAGLAGLLAPAMQQSQQSLLARFELLCRVPLDSWNNAGNEPARLAHLDYRNQRAILVESGERSAEVIRLRHGAPRRLFPATMMPCPRRSPHSISE